MNNVRFRQIGALVLVLALAGPAWAEDKPPKDKQLADFDLASTVSIVTDYRFRGISLSDRKPAAQASIDVSHRSGVHASLWGSNIARYGGSKVEIDATLGWKGEAGPVDLDVGAMAYLYPGGQGVNIYEGFAYVGKTIGPAALRAGIIYAPSQTNTGNSDNLYLTADTRVGIPGTPITLTGVVGRERGALAGPVGHKWDWQLGGEYVKGPFVFGVTYVDTNVKAADDPSRDSRAGLVGSVSFAF